MFDGENYNPDEPQDDPEILGWISGVLKSIANEQDETVKASLFAECVVGVWMFKVETGRSLNLGPLRPHYDELRRRLEAQFGPL